MQPIHFGKLIFDRQIATRNLTPEQLGKLDTAIAFLCVHLT